MAIKASTWTSRRCVEAEGTGQQLAMIQGMAAARDECVRRGTTPCDLGQGYPDFPPPEAILRALAEACGAAPAPSASCSEPGSGPEGVAPGEDRGEGHQYCPPGGHPMLKEAIAARSWRRSGILYEARDEVSVTVGATEGIQAACLGLLDPGDEVVTLAPAFPWYASCVALAGATLRCVPLHPPAFRWDAAELQAAFSARTKLVIVNSPHNPTGRVLDEAELRAIAELCVAHDCLALSDEVYSHVCFDGRAHVPLASLPGMRARTLVLESGGKILCATGWRVGWALGPAPILRPLALCAQFGTFCAPTPLQLAVARGLAEDQEAGPIDDAARAFERNRDALAAALTATGFDVAPGGAEGGFFLVADAAPLVVDADRADGSGGPAHADVSFCRRLLLASGVCAYPLSPFYPQGSRPPGPSRCTLVRFAICKRERTIDRACTLLLAAKDALHAAVRHDQEGRSPSESWPSTSPQDGWMDAPHLHPDDHPGQSKP